MFSSCNTSVLGSPPILTSSTRPNTQNSQSVSSSQRLSHCCFSFPCYSGMAMRGGKQLLLLAAFVLLARCQQKPKVSMSPTLTQIFSGDIFYLSCDNSTSGNTVKWYVNNTENVQTNKTWKIAVANSKHSGSYQCESNGQKSDTFDIDVLEYIPSASLIIKTGHPVMRTGSSVVLELENEDGLQGWNCWVYRGENTRKIMLKLNNDSVSLAFQPKSLNVPETIFWCTDQTKELRSNQITVKTSEKDVMLEMDPLPAVAGGSLTLKCFVWGTDKISHAVFYKDDAIIMNTLGPTYEISGVTESDKGRYKCDATYTHRARTRGPPYKEVSDNQDIFVQAPPMKAVVSENMGLSCSCPVCPSTNSYRWYYKNGGESWARMTSDHGSMMPTESGIYACQAVWKNKRSFLSNGYVYHPLIKSILLAVVIVLVILGCVAVAFYIWYKKRNTTGPIYEDVALRSRDKGDDKYEPLQQPRGGQREGEYDTLHPEAPGREKKEGEYQPLKKEEMKEGVYHTLGMEGAAGGTGGYEALKKEGMKEGVYHTLGTEGAGGGEGGHEAVGKDKDKEYEIVDEKK